MLIAGVPYAVGKFERSAGDVAEMEAGQRAKRLVSNSPIHVIDECENVAKGPTRILTTVADVTLGIISPSWRHIVSDEARSS
jgi:hypothetical protein